MLCFRVCGVGSQARLSISQYIIVQVVVDRTMETEREQLDLTISKLLTYQLGFVDAAHAGAGSVRWCVVAVVGVVVVIVVLVVVVVVVICRIVSGVVEVVRMTRPNSR